MVSDLETFVYKGFKLPRKKRLIFGKFCLSSRIFLVLVLLSALVQICFVSHIWDFCGKIFRNKMSRQSHVWSMLIYLPWMDLKIWGWKLQRRRSCWGGSINHEERDGKKKWWRKNTKIGSFQYEVRYSRPLK